MRGGEGESQLEADRRKVGERIDRIERDLDAVRQQRETQRAGRQRNQWPLASIVGYTNAGKSTLLNKLTGAEVLAKDILFATLDPTTRRLRLPTNKTFCSPTPWFHQKLPHGLVESFKADALEEVVQADLLLHVVDVSHPQADEQIAAVNSVLNELGAGNKATMMVFNKVDQLNGGNPLARLHELYPNSVAISARTGKGIEELLAEISTQIRPEQELVELKIPHEEAALIARLHKVGQVLERKYLTKVAKFSAHPATSSRGVCGVYCAGIALWCGVSSEDYRRFDDSLRSYIQNSLMSVSVW